MVDVFTTHHRAAAAPSCMLGAWSVTAFRGA
jgi:hypothetical protein